MVAPLALDQTYAGVGREIDSCRGWAGGRFIRAFGLRLSGYSRLHRRYAGFGDVFVFLRALTTDADRADYLSLIANGQAALQRSRSGKRQSGYTALADLIFKIFAGAPEDGCGACLADADFNTRYLGIVGAMQHEQMSAVVD